MRTHMLQYADTYVAVLAVCGHKCCSMQTRIWQHICSSSTPTVTCNSRIYAAAAHLQSRAAAAYMQQQHTYSHVQQQHICSSSTLTVTCSSSIYAEAAHLQSRERPQGASTFSQPPGMQLLRCQYVYFCTSKASKLSSCTFSQPPGGQEAPQVSVFVLLY